MTSPLDWTHETTEISDRGLKRERAANAHECAALAAALDLPAIGNLVVRYSIEPRKGEAWRLAGSLSADVTQTCVVSLEPIAAHVADDFEAVFRREAEARGAEPEDQAILSGEDVEPIERDQIDVGRIVYETLSAGLDPYPRKAGAEFDWTDPKAGDPERPSNPFAVLKKLKDPG